MMWEKIFEKIKEYETIVIARHIGVDPDAMASQIALKESIEATFPEKKVYAVGQGSCKFTYLGHLERLENVDYQKTLLMVLDTPDKRRVDIDNIDLYHYKIKIDHHPFVEEFCDIEVIEENSSSTCQLITEFLIATPLVKTKKMMEKLLQGIVSDTNRFMFQNSKSSTFHLVGKMMEDFDLDLPSLYAPLYLRPLKEVRLQGYIEQNMTVTENKVAYIYITEEIINQFKTDASAAGNMINNFNYIEEVLVWITISEDRKNDIFKISMRSRGPIINKVAEKYHGGGHALASGARVKTKEETNQLLAELESVCKEFLKEEVVE